MRSLSGVGLGLSLVFGCLLLALVAELYYLLWWKKRFTNREIEDDYSSPAREMLYMFCWKKPSSLSSTALNPQELCSSMRIRDTTHVDDDHEAEATTTASSAQIHLDGNKDLLLKPFGEDGVESEFMRLYDLSGPPRFLFTIKEETREDLESEDGNRSRGDNKSRKGSRSRSLSDLVLTVETPFLTPLSSPPFFTPPLTPMDSSVIYHNYESSTDALFNKIRSSPPPKFKFLQDAEEKLYRRKLMEEEDEKRVHIITDGSAQEFGFKAPNTSNFIKDDEDGSFITIIVAKNKEETRELNHSHHSSSSQVLPLASSPSSFKPQANNKKFISN